MISFWLVSCRRFMSVLCLLKVIAKSVYVVCKFLKDIETGMVFRWQIFHRMVPKTGLIVSSVVLRLINDVVWAEVKGSFRL